MLLCAIYFARPLRLLRSCHPRPLRGATCRQASALLSPLTLHLSLAKITKVVGQTSRNQQIITSPIYTRLIRISVTPCCTFILGMVFLLLDALVLQKPIWNRTSFAPRRTHFLRVDVDPRTAVCEKNFAQPVQLCIIVLLATSCVVPTNFYFSAISTYDFPTNLLRPNRHLYIT